MSSKLNCTFCFYGYLSILGVSLFTLKKLVSYLLSKREKIPEGLKQLIFAEEELNLENFENVLKRHTIRFNDSKVMEEILPRVFTNEAQLSKISDNFIYAEGQHDLLSLSKVPCF